MDPQAACPLWVGSWLVKLQGLRHMALVCLLNPGRHVLVGKNPPANAGDRDLGWEDPSEKGMATHFSILAWRTP